MTQHPADLIGIGGHMKPPIHELRDQLGRIGKDITRRHQAVAHRPVIGAEPQLVTPARIILVRPRLRRQANRGADALRMGGIAPTDIVAIQSVGGGQCLPNRLHQRRHAAILPPVVRSVIV